MYALSKGMQKMQQYPVCPPSSWGAHGAVPGRKEEAATDTDDIWGRPCERCVKYGFKDCVDSTRKPRKTGIKR